MSRMKARAIDQANGRNVVLRGDCLEVMRTLPENSVDAVVTDPPYELGFMGKSWDSAGVSYDPATWAEALRVLKPGGHLLAFGGSRTYHRIAVAIEDAGFEIRDSLMWIYGSGFPKSLDVSKAIDKKAGAERKVVVDKRWLNQYPNGNGGNHNRGVIYGAASSVLGQPLTTTLSATDEAKRWEGWGTALTPSHEPIVLARKPLIGTVAENVLAFGTGALNIDASRIPTNGEKIAPFGTPTKSIGGLMNNGVEPQDSAKLALSYAKTEQDGRWPANTLWDEEAAAQLDASTPAQPSRFFYVAKPGRRERNAGLDGFQKREFNQNAQPNPKRAIRPKTPAANIHPTVKPIALMRYLIKLITPPGGVVLDPFLGSGTTACAAVLEGFDYIGIEMTPEYADIAEARIKHWKKSK